MHRLITKPPKNMQVDHIDGNCLNNQKNNLRICTHSENMKNRKANSNKRFKGVEKVPSGKWRAQITVNGKKIYIGTYETELEAAQAYDKEAVKFHKEYSKTNF